MDLKSKTIPFLLLTTVILLSFFKSTNVVGSTEYIDDIYQVKTTSDIKYGQATGYSGQPEELLLDIYQPIENSDSLKPLIIFVHGGSFVSGDKSVYTANATGLAKKGYIVSSINYRLDTTHDGPYNARSTDLDKPIGTSREDTLTALRFLINNASKYKIDTEKIFLGGSSAGALTALYTAYSEELDAKKIKAVYSIAGTVIDKDFEIIDSNDPPTMMFNGTEDGIIPYEMAQETINKLNSKGITAELITYEGGTHSIITQQSVDIHQKLIQFLLPYVTGNIPKKNIPAVTLTLTPIPTATPVCPNEICLSPTANIVLTSTPFLTPTKTAVIGDLNYDGAINNFDINEILKNYLFGDKKADLNNDGVVNGYDYSILYEKINH